MWIRDSFVSWKFKRDDRNSARTSRRHVKDDSICNIPGICNWFSGRTLRLGSEDAIWFRGLQRIRSERWSRNWFEFFITSVCITSTKSLSIKSHHWKVIFSHIDFILISLHLLLLFLSAFILIACSVILTTRKLSEQRFIWSWKFRRLTIRFESVLMSSKRWRLYRDMCTSLLDRSWGVLLVHVVIYHTSIIILFLEKAIFDLKLHHVSSTIGFLRLMNRLIFAL